MATSVAVSTLLAKPSISSQFLERRQAKGLPSLARSSSSLRVEAKGRKINTDKPYGNYLLYLSTMSMHECTYIYTHIFACMLPG